MRFVDGPERKMPLQAVIHCLYGPALLTFTGVIGKP